MKKTIACILALAMVITSITYMPKKIEAKTIDHIVDSYLNCIKISWSKYKKAKKYVVHRAISKERYPDKLPKRSKFKVIKKTKNFYYKDKKAKKNKNYIYYIDVIGKKGKVIATSYDRRYSPVVACKGLDIPVLDNRGNGEDYTNSPSKIYLSAGFGSLGYYPKKRNYVFYRKEKGSKERYKKIKVKKVNNADEVFFDNTVQGGKTYLYKCKATVTKKKKKYYSKFSDVLKVPAVNMKAKLTVDILTKSVEYKGRDSMEAVIKVTDVDRYNGKVVFYNGEGHLSERFYNCYKTKAEYDNNNGRYYFFDFTQYSKDGENWIDVPRNGVELPKMGSLYLKMRIDIYFAQPSQELSVVFAGPDSGYYASYCDSYNVMCRYYGPGDDNTSFYLDLIKSTIEVKQVWE